MIADAVTIPRRFNGPPHSGNGGYVCGRLASCLDGPASVRLRVPPPLERDLRVEAGDDEARMFDGDTLVAQARRIPLDLAAPTAPSFAEAQAASKSCIGFQRHPAPHCFVCGPQRAEGDGLCIFPGRTADDALFAAPWVPHVSLDDGTGHVAPEFLWAALDCPGAFAVMPDAMQPIILGELCARLDGTVAIGERCVVAAWAIGSEGRKRFAGTALYSASGAAVAVARATWIELANVPAGES